MQKAVRLKRNGSYKITSTKAWRDFLEGLAKDIEGGTLRRWPDVETEARPNARQGNACVKCCGRGGVEFCGMYIAICTDGSTCVLG